MKKRDLANFHGNGRWVLCISVFVPQFAFLYWGICFKRKVTTLESTRLPSCQLVAWDSKDWRWLPACGFCWRACQTASAFSPGNVDWKLSKIKEYFFNNLSYISWGRNPAREIRLQRRKRTLRKDKWSQNNIERAKKCKQTATKTIFANSLLVIKATIQWQQ